MAISKPYHRISRPMYGRDIYHGGYIYHAEYANAPRRFTRAFLLLQEDVKELFNYIEPADRNLNTYSFRTHELLMRACIEVEANCKSILLENKYSKEAHKLRMKDDYSRIEISHRLSSYKVTLPYWEGEQSVLQPFERWAKNEELPWYKTYNDTKHNRSELFHEATFSAMLNAVAGLAALLWAQFGDEDFLPKPSFYSTSDSEDSAAGGYFQIAPPSDWEDAEKYNFSWETLKKYGEPFQNFDYDAVKR